MYNSIFNYDDVSDVLDISYFLLTDSNSDNYQYNNIITTLNYYDLIVIFLFGLLTSLCILNCCCKSENTNTKYIIIEQDTNNKTVSV